MQGGYNIQPLIDLLDDPKWGCSAVEQLSTTLLIFEKFKDIEEKANQGMSRRKT
jgi:aconitate hydratase 2/2-methylisocitrate dehydratase